MTRFIDLGRQFRDLKGCESKEFEDSINLENYFTGAVADWSDILASQRVLLLAEAGSGKTREMKERADLLNRQGQLGIFVPLEALFRGSLEQYLSSESKCDFLAWKASSTSLAWFFLDSVDELKLTSGRLNTALTRLARDIDGRLGRASVILSSRPSDWRPTVDLSIFMEILPIPAHLLKATPSNPEAFLAPVPRSKRRIRGYGPNIAMEQEKTVRIVAMLPLSTAQIRMFAAAQNVRSLDDLVAEIERRDAWQFANRPLDLSDLIATWNRTERIGTRAEQHDDSVTARLRDDPDRFDNSALSRDKARLGAEQLALALVLSRKRMILTPELAVAEDRKDGALDASIILPTWTQGEICSLLRRALFDPATYGRVRFHHRSIQEYLAARCLLRLRQSGMTQVTLLDLIFADQYHTPVVIPSMRPVAAWISLWDDDVRAELMKREPEALLQLGDPESLPLRERCKLLRAFAKLYGDGGWRGIGIPISEVRRLSCSDLAPTIQEIWSHGPQNEDLRILLLEVIWCGTVADCMNIAKTVAQNPFAPARERLIAIHALLACNQFDTLNEVARDLVSNVDTWAPRNVSTLAGLLFPKFLDLDALMTLVERTPEPDRTVGGFGWEALQIATALDPLSEIAVAFRNRIADLIWHHQDRPFDQHNIRSRFDYLAPALARICHRQLVTSSHILDDGILRSCVISSRFGGQRRRINDPLRDLTSTVRAEPEIRQAIFWTEVKIMDTLLPGRDDWQRFFHTLHESLLDHLVKEDLEWIKAELAGSNSNPSRRAIAFQAWVTIWQQQVGSDDELNSIRVIVQDDAELSASADRLTLPVRPSLEPPKFALEPACQQLAVEAAQAEARDQWDAWRQKLLTETNNCFSSANEAATLRSMYSWLQRKSQGHNQYNVWSRDVVEQEFGLAIAELVMKAGRRYWRSMRPLPPTEREPDNWNVTEQSWIFGLCWISAEASYPRWTAQCTEDDAEIAAAYAMVELNGFSSFIDDLTVAFPKAVDNVIGSEISAQMVLSNKVRFLPALQNLGQASALLQQLLAPRLLFALQAFATDASGDEAHNLAYNLEAALRIVSNCLEGAERSQIIEFCATKFIQCRSESLALCWLRGLFMLDAFRGAQVVIPFIKSCESVTTATQRATAILVALFGERGSSSFAVTDPSKRAEALGDLIRVAYTYIQPKDDQHHEGGFTPNYRDNAESARQFLLGALIQTPGPKAGAILHELAREPAFAHFPDRLRMFARQRAASDSEPQALAQAQIVNFVKEHQFPLSDRDGMFKIMISRLKELAHEIAHNDLTDRPVLQSITSEEDMQRSLALRLQHLSRGMYTITREDEAADRKRVDIRLSSTFNQEKAVIEVKIADNNWTLPQLEEALSAQLLGQYLRHAHCKAGCLLITFAGRKRFWLGHNKSQHLSFDQVIDHLKQRAVALEAAEAFELRLAVFCLNLTDPLLVNARRV